MVLSVGGSDARVLVADSVVDSVGNVVVDGAIVVVTGS